MKLFSTIAISILFVISGCATQPEKLPSSYVSPLKYKSYSCNQIIMEMDHVSKKTNDLYMRLKKKADDDATQMGVGLILFWPALFFLEGGDGPEATEYANMKGEFEALRKAAVQKECNMSGAPRSPEEIIKEQAVAEKVRKDKEQAAQRKAMGF